MCSRIVKDAHGQTQHTYGVPRPVRSYADHTGSSRLLPSSRIFTDQNCSFDLSKTAVCASGAPRTFPDVQGHSQIDTELHGTHAGSFRI
ncbi:hypothetical protein DPMN_004105 [Dreissena polymorpha]|uniref:Uncharacterized protein n=1 Tax=Dreissena polymorpha TaxID=45954 RepID=A0A9D4MQ72_DREPO|nr:hypothetical protein DPMN_004105 [Dreissena polymorpha]